MSILTNFLKLVKPEKNDYVDVEEHISNNLDKIDEKMENFNLNKLDKGGYTGTAQNLLTEISKIASKTVLGRMIVGKGLTVDSSGRTSVVSKNDGIIVNDNDIQLNVYDGVDSSSTTRAGSAKAVKQVNDNANGRVSKNGDEMEGKLKINTSLPAMLELNRVGTTNENNSIKFGMKDGEIIKYLGFGGSDLYIANTEAMSSGNLVYHTGNFYPVNSLTDNSVDKPLASNQGMILKELVDESFWRTKAKEIAPDYSKQSIIEKAKTLEDGVYMSRTTSNDWGDLPFYISGAFYLKIETIVGSTGNKYKYITLTNYDGGIEATLNTFYSAVKWYHNIKTETPLFNSVVGIDQVRFIQDVGIKYTNKLYFDKVTFKPYRPKVANTDVDVTSNFSPASIYDNNNKLANIMSVDDKSIDAGNKIIFKTGTANVNENSGVVTFDTPFPNACLSVIFTDVSSMKSESSIISLDASTPLTKNGFKAFGSLNTAGTDRYNYLAIGY